MKAERIFCRVLCAEPTAFLKQLSDWDVTAYEVSRIDDLVIAFSVDGINYKKVCSIARKNRAELIVVKREGWLPIVMAVRKRIVLLFAVILLVVLSLWLPTRILFISVEGNASVDKNVVLSAAEGCGLGFGVSRRALRSEIIKNHLLKELPQLQWVGVNTSGCTATILVRESILETDQEILSNGQMYALCDGIVLEATVTSGYPVVSVGQAVKAGQLLVSNHQDENHLSPETEVSAEIFALTLRRFTVAVPTISVKKLYLQDQMKDHAVLIGKKRIYFTKYSGILPTGCDKMYSQVYTHLPGGFTLPFGIETQTKQEYARVETSLSREEVLSSAEGIARSWLKEQMVAGRILSCRSKITEWSDFALVDFEYQCVEMIGRIYHKENR